MPAKPHPSAATRARPGPSGFARAAGAILLRLAVVLVTVLLFGWTLAEPAARSAPLGLTSLPAVSPDRAAPPSVSPDPTSSSVPPESTAPPTLSRDPSAPAEPPGPSAPPAASPDPTAPPAEPPGLPAPHPRYGWPVSAPHPVLRPFVPPASPYGPGHRGVDLGAPEGAPVYAAGDGTVVYAGPVAGRGVVSIQHAEGLRTTYEPVRAMVRRGQVVHRGQRIGSLRHGHRCGRDPAATCLHWGVRRGAGYLDPLGLLAGGHVRLLPWHAP